MVNDILQEVTNEDVLLLKSVYGKYKREFPPVYGFLSRYIAWKGKIENFKLFRVKSDDWLKSGTFVSIWDYTSCNLFAYTLEADCKTLQKALFQTTRIKWGSQRVWFLVGNRCISAVREAINKLELVHSNQFDSELWTISSETALQLEINYPDDIYIQTLDKSHVDRINTYWPHRHKGSEKYLSTLIDMNEAFGVFLKSDDDLVCWVLRNHFGLLCNLQTLPEHERKGYATLVTKIAAKKLAENGNDLVGCIIIKGNSRSERMFSKLNFRKHEDCMFIENMCHNGGIK